MNLAPDSSSCSFDEAALNHLRDGLTASVEQRWQWLREAMELAVANAKRRAKQGKVTLTADLEIWWSPQQAQIWHEQGCLSQTGGQDYKP